jgi:hypothetical protein
MPKPTIDWAVARGMALSGIPLREIARQLGIPPSTVTSRASREAWKISANFGPTNSNHVPLAIRQDLAAASAHTAQAAINSLREKNSKSRHALASATLKASQHLENLDGKKLVKHSDKLEKVVRSASKVFGWSDGPQNDPANMIKDDLFALSPQQLAALARAEEANLRLKQAKPAHARVLEP